MKIREIITEGEGNSVITFPKNEWHIYKQYIKEKKPISTLRMCREFQKYKVGNRYKTEWGDYFTVIKSEIFDNLDAVFEKYPAYYKTMSTDQQQEAREYCDKIERITLSPETN